MKKYDVDFVYSIEGTMVIEANTPTEAKEKAEEILTYGLPHDENVSYIGSAGSVASVSETDEE